jgi:phage terminase Nu1 subunit (DNA packaging protein)
MTRVHERKLAESLEPVERAIRDWREGRGPIVATDDAIHQHQMRSRRYWHLYANTAASSPEAGYILDEALELKLISPAEHKELTALWSRPKPQR